MIDEQTLQQVVNDVCSGMLGLHMEPSHDCYCEDPSALSAVIRISGKWGSVVQMLTPRRTAVAIACRMFELNEDELSETDIRDAVGEIVNMVGGNLKGITGGESSMSMPCVGELGGVDLFDGRFTGLSVSNRCEGDSLIVRVFDQSPNAVT